MIRDIIDVTGITLTLPLHSGLQNQDLAPVVQTLDSAIQWINHYPLDNSIGFASVYPLDTDLSGGQRYPSFEQLGPDNDSGRADAKTDRKVNN